MTPPLVPWAVGDWFVLGLARARTGEAALPVIMLTARGDDLDIVGDRQLDALT